MVERLHDVHYIELGNDPFTTGEGLDEMMAEISEFLTGSRAASHADRSLAAVLFVDLVGSTELAAELGDTRWRDVLGAFRIAVRRELDRYGGQEVNTRGDDFLARFDRASSAIECASELRSAIAGMDLHLRAGVHVGEVDLDGDDLSGVAVHVGARVASLARPRRDPRHHRGSRGGRGHDVVVRGPRHPPAEGRPGRVEALRGRLVG